MPSGAFCCADNMDDASRNRRAKAFIENLLCTTAIRIHAWLSADNSLQRFRHRSHWFGINTLKRAPDSTFSNIPDLQSRTMTISHRIRIGLLLIAATAIGLTFSLRASTSEEQEVMAPIKAMFDSMAKHDAAALKQSVLPGGTMVLMRNGQPKQLTFDAFAELIAKPG